MDEDLIALSRSPERDPDGSKFKAALAAHLACEKARVVRQFFVTTLALTSVFVWPAAAWPHLLSPEIRALVLALWATCGALALGARILEWRWQRIRARYVSELESGAGTIEP